MYWTVLLSLLFGTALSQVASDTITATTNGDQCYSSVNVSSLSVLVPLTVAKNCCSFESQQCQFQHNGKCVQRCEANKCDYLVDVCVRKPSELCTCCALCDGPNAVNECKQHGGTCRRHCFQDEDCLWQHKCNSPNCRCCIRSCPDTCGPDGIGKCFPSNVAPPSTWFDYGQCPGERYKCRCYTQCTQVNTDCYTRGGLCRPRWYTCPNGYKEKDCVDCHEKDCKCCIKEDSGSSGKLPPIKFKSSSSFEVEILGGGGPPPAEPIGEIDDEPNEEDY